ncbi:carbamoyl-phosphate synthase / aspartate carbamoyltransferase / dihydroorotase [Schistosoma bovis]|uniref:Carbamoyl phosphate synthase arginine-specific large chain n=1 Tax=Schistosoma bovis TaxID=6184 RepID=A0A430QN98_SCHBO|nr:carbamoyl-phosphate synthase / aspartate carbamoyltransferase / dihydroorotase [Schistosoma bovis]
MPNSDRAGALVLEDGSVFNGFLYGAKIPQSGEVVFQTGMVGYVESLTDPSYHSQLLVLTYPSIGNYGVPSPDDVDECGLPRWFESRQIYAKGLIVSELCEEFSHFSAVKSLSHWLYESGVTCISGIDTRSLTLKLRQHGTLLGKIIPLSLDPETLDWIDPAKNNLVSEVSRTDIKVFNPHGDVHIAALDCGMKFNQIRCFVKRGAKNHGYAVDTKNIPDGWYELFRNKNDHSNEGLAHHIYPWMTVQFHPEHMAGPSDLEFLFDVFLNYIRSSGGQSLSDHLTRHISYNQEEFERVLCSKDNKPRKVLLLGSGGLSIGQAGEFDYSGSQALKALREEGVQTLLINSNIATVQTTEGMADKIFLLPIAPDSVARVIKAERPDGLLIAFGGQTSLSCGLALTKVRSSSLISDLKGEDSGASNVLDLYNCRILGTSISAVEITEDRELFAIAMRAIGEKVAPANAATSVQDAVKVANDLGYPVLVRAAFALGGMGSGFAENATELERLAGKALAQTTQIFIDKSLKGWKEVEYEVIRDAYDNCITVCNMENVDPVGIHTGESIVVSPSQTLSNVEYYMLRSVAIKVARHLRIVGECNIQFALDPHSLNYYIIEVNARLSRSSALASKATGYPIAYIAAKLSLGRSLPELTNSVTGDHTTACFEPSLDYCVVKVPRWDLAKFSRVSRKIGSSMKSVGEVMAIARCFEEALQKSLRMTNESVSGFDGSLEVPDEDDLSDPTDVRIYKLSAALRSGWSVERLHALTSIDPWFLYRMRSIVNCAKELESLHDGALPNAMKLLECIPTTVPDKSSFHTLVRNAERVMIAKRLGFSDVQLARALRSTSVMVRWFRKHLNLKPLIRLVDTVAGEWPATTNYLYTTYADIPLGNIQLLLKSFHDGQTETLVSQEMIDLLLKCMTVTKIHDVSPEQKSSIMVLGSGVYRIGSSVEFDWCAVGCVKGLRRLGWKTVIINCNPETVSTDFDMCDRLYFDELSLERVLDIYEFESPIGVIVSMGGQTPNNIAMPMHRLGVPILGTSAESIDNAENRFKFSRLLDCIGLSQPRWKELTDIDSAKAFCEEVGYPCLVRPSYVLSGAAMNVANDHDQLITFLTAAKNISPEHPVVISQFILDAKEIDVDAVAQSGRLVAMAVSEHVENAGVHSGDATLVTPPQDLNEETLKLIKELVRALADELEVSGPFNLQLLAKDNRLLIIEANLRVSRSFPFVSKTLKYDFIAAATRAILGAARDSIHPPFDTHSSKVERLSLSKSFLEPSVNVLENTVGYVGVKVPVFSFARLLGADVLLGVEMVSTGEVACFGVDRYEAYLLAQAAALCNTNGLLPKPGDNVFLSIGSYRHKLEMLPSLSLKKVGSRRLSAFVTRGYQTRRLAVDTNVPLLTDVKLAKLLIEALYRYFYGQNANKTVIKSEDNEYNVYKQSFLHRLLPLHSITSSQIIYLPGLIDIHVHTRDPGMEYKEDWTSVTKAALAGGIVTILAMPNTDPAIVDEDTFNIMSRNATSKACCDYGLYVGASSENASTISSLSHKAVGLKMYLNETFTCLSLGNKLNIWRQHFENWPSDRPICCHAEGETIAAVILLAEITGRSVHICHVARRAEIELIRDAKQRGLKVTCEVCPHHLFLTADDLPQEGGWNEVRPRLGTADDINALWANINTIDCFATDHAPHTISEKSKVSGAPPGFPGLETMLSLLLTAMYNGRLTLTELIERLYINPYKIFGIPTAHTLYEAVNSVSRGIYGETWVEVDMSAEWRIPGAAWETKSESAPSFFTRANWSPFAGRVVRGQVRRVMLRGHLAFVDGRVLVEPGFGKDVSSDISLPKNSYDPLTIDTSLKHIPVSTGSPTLRNRYNSINERVQVSQDEPGTPIPAATQSDEGPRSPIVAYQPSVSGLIPTAQLPQTHQTLPSMWLEGLSGKHILSSLDFSRDHLRRLYNLAHSFRVALNKNKPLDQICRGKVMGNLFFEPSTRTSNSFAIAMQRLGGTVMHFSESTSSQTKGETVLDTVRILASYCDCLVIRHPGKGAIHALANSIVHKPIINAGDGIGEHPTQALLDVFTIREEIGTVNGLTITMVGDLANGRTVHSLARLLCLYKVKLRYVTHRDEFKMPPEVKSYVADRGIPQEEMTSLEEALPDTDVLYMTRVQTERMSDDRDARRDQFVVTPELMTLAKPRGMIVMHPLPRVGEISPKFDSDPRAAYFRQAEYGTHVRMALLAIVLANQK